MYLYRFNQFFFLFLSFFLFLIIRRNGTRRFQEKHFPQWDTWLSYLLEDKRSNAFNPMYLSNRVEEIFEIEFHPITKSG